MATDTSYLTAHAALHNGALTWTDGASTQEPIAEIQRRARLLGRGCALRAAEHQLCAERWRRRSLELGTVVTLCAAGAGAALLSSAPEDGAIAIVFGVLGVLAAAIAALNQAFAPQSRGELHRHAAAGFTALRTALYNLAALPASDLPAVREAFAAVMERKARLELQSPLPEEWAKRPRQAKRRDRIAATAEEPVEAAAVAEV